jgi:putative membrane protein
MIGGGGFFIGFIFLILFLVLVGVVIAAIVWLVRHGSHGMSHSSKQELPQRNEALEILRQRYARGEIDRDEFERMREELRS